MQFEFYIKYGKNRYIKKLVEPEIHTNWRWFKSLKLGIENTLKDIRIDLLQYFNGDTRFKLSKPKHDDWEIQKKIDKLVSIRKVNTDIRNILTDILSTNEFIICECKSIMYKTPINVSYEKIGTRYILLDDLHGQKPKYVFMCEQCHRAIVEEAYMKTQGLQKQRVELLKKGYNWVPNNSGFWYKFDSKPLNKSPEMCDT